MDRSRTRTVEYLGEEVGNLIDPSATQTSNKQQHAFIVALEQVADTELGGPYDEAKGEDGPSWSALMDHEYPLNLTGACVQQIFRCSQIYHVWGHPRRWQATVQATGERGVWPNRLRPTSNMTLQV